MKTLRLLVLAGIVACGSGCALIGCQAGSVCGACDYSYNLDGCSALQESLNTCAFDCTAGDVANTGFADFNCTGWSELSYGGADSRCGRACEAYGMPSSCAELQTFLDGCASDCTEGILPSMGFQAFDVATCTDLTYGGARYSATAELTPIQPTPDETSACDSDYNAVYPDQPYVCDNIDGQGEGRQTVQFDGPPKTWAQLPSALDVVFNAPNGLRMQASGDFGIRLTLVATQVDIPNPGGWYFDEFNPGAPANGTTCTVTTTSGNSQSNACESLSIQTYGDGGGGSYANTCKLKVSTTVSFPSNLDSSTLTLSVDLGTASGIIRHAWETYCVPGELEYSWVERYYFTGFTTYNNENTNLSFVDAPGTGGPAAGTSSGQHLRSGLVLLLAAAAALMAV